MVRPLRARSYVFTINNYTDDQCAFIKSTLVHNKRVKYLFIGKEIAPTTGTPHLQGFVHWTDARPKDAAMKDISPSRSFWIKPADGTPHESKKYCGKDGAWISVGTPPRVWSKDKVPEDEGGNVKPVPINTQLEDVKSAVMDGKRMTNLYDEHFPMMCRYRSGVMGLYDHNRMYVPKPKPTVYTLWGPTFCGKSEWVSRVFGLPSHDVYWATMNAGGKLWCGGYDQQVAFVIDEFNPYHMDVNFFKQLLDKYSCMLEAKGQQFPMTSKYIILTSNYDPSGWYRDPFIENQADDLNYNAVQRRLGTVMKFVNVWPKDNPAAQILYSCGHPEPVIPELQSAPPSIASSISDGNNNNNNNNSNLPGFHLICTYCDDDDCRGCGPVDLSPTHSRVTPPDSSIIPACFARKKFKPVQEKAIRFAKNPYVALEAYCDDDDDEEELEDYFDASDADFIDDDDN